ncbi:autotransporter outer membrane beta-barrel domain-containing protein, partial [Klebsiella aerogenes]|uniref:autotransporter outer membrane beta-barrel domain-containing protein n=1 Tax=Klebsiella aerogenes TaxID=548 RepID=UPI0013CFCF5E
STATLTVNGDLTLKSGSNYNVTVSPSAAGRTNAIGIATLSGAVNASYVAGSYTAKQYTILNATGGVARTFDTLNNMGLPPNVRAALSY